MTLERVDKVDQHRVLRSKVLLKTETCAQHGLCILVRLGGPVVSHGSQDFPPHHDYKH